MKSCNEGDAVGSPPPGDGKKRVLPALFWSRLTISLIAGAAIGFKIGFPAVKVDGVVLGLIVLGTIPWLSSVIKSFELTGIGKIELLQQIEKTVEDVKGTAESARALSERAIAQSEIVAPAVSGQRIEPEDFFARAKLLVDEYGKIREEMSASPERSKKMTDVVTRMSDLARQYVDWDAITKYDDADRGWRLMAYAFSYVNPNFGMFENLVSSAISHADDNKPFGQYWSILAMQKVLAVRNDGQVRPSVWKRLKEFYRGLSAGTDRHDEMKRLLYGHDFE